MSDIDQKSLPTYIGKVLFFSPKRGSGFLEWHIDGVKQKDMFAHFSDISMQGFKTVNADQKVSFQIGTNKNGDPKAINILIVSDE